MGILSKSIRNRHDSPRNGQDVMSTWETNVSWKIQYDCTSEPFTKPTLSSTLINRMTTFTLGSKKQSITLDTFKHIIGDLATQLERVTTKVFRQSEAYSVVDDLSLEECKVFTDRWSEELKCLRSKYRSHLGKISNVERFRRSLEGLNIREDQFQKLTEAQKDFLWFIHILKSLPKSSVCQEGCARVELLNFYRQWKKGQLINMLPIIDFIMKTLLKEKDSILKRKLQHRSA
ncbi:uncharacterized protein zgc:113314 isoform X2 [Megalobrama amblycephala]|uniref:uncharacterized protein zgc:113314 isoform X2 n=1 Tax=Megalobrama amblycephala TaxID=75352 RepID=UPI00201463A5|nr:uncharacterized protein zgc:113314 isoform X2 [Megalobrama amblycephala]